MGAGEAAEDGLAEAGSELALGLLGALSAWRRAGRPGQGERPAGHADPRRARTPASLRQPTGRSCARFGEWTVADVERLLAEQGARSRTEGGARALPRLLPGVAGPDGRLPGDVDLVIEDVFAPLIERARSAVTIGSANPPGWSRGAWTVAPAVRYDGRRPSTRRVDQLPPELSRKEGREVVRAIHRTGSPGRRPRPGRGPRPQAQLHRHGAHSPRPAARGGGACRAGARVARHHRGRGARAGRPHRRPGRRGDDGPDPVHAAREEGARAGAARGALARPQLHRHRAHPARARARERGGRRADPARLRRRRREDPQRDHPHALRPRPAPAGLRRRLRREGEELEAARPVRAQPDQGGHRRQARSRRRAPDRDRARDADPLAPPEEQPGADRRAGRRQDRRRRGARQPDLHQPGPRAAEEQADLHARPGRPRRRLQVPRRVRGAAEEGDEGDHAAGRHHPLHRRAP